MCEVMKKYEDIAREEGLRIGIEQGKELGIEQGKELGIELGIISVATGMLKNNFAPEIVAECCGLPLNEVLQLVKR